MATLRKNISQVGYPKAGDIDDCWLVATLTCLRNISPWLKLPDAQVFREAAGVPDRSGRSDGGTGADIARGLQELYPGLEWRGTLFPFSYFKGLMKPGFVASVAVHSAYLPSALQYGFRGGHRIAVELLPDGTWIILNPLAKSGTAPQRISQAALRKAAEMWSSPGQIGAIVFDPAVVKEYFKLNVYVRTNTPGRFSVKAGQAVRVWRWGNGGWRLKTKVTVTANTVGKFDYRLDRTAGLATPAHLFHVTEGPGKDYFVQGADVAESYDVPAPTFTKAQLDAAVAAGKAEVKAAIADVKTAISSALSRL